ncbi:MAG: cation-translocating P-type ATPase, partial [Candidatus Bathyarchaeota archaeon]|nr:cation-translocating P-type ATPase [Candidatus Bathyarchaeota archaeon]
KPPHATEINEALQILNSNQNGLTSQEAQERLKKFGYNELKEKKRKTALQMFLSEFKDIFILLLIIAAIFSAVVGYYELQRPLMPGELPKEPLEEYADSIVIAIIVVLVAVAGFVQEYRAEKALEALKKLAAPKAHVLRDGRETIIPAREVVPGDILVLESGDLVPADARLIESIEIKADEAVLTGESTPVNKDAKAILPPEAPIGDRRNMVFTATHIIYGRGKAVVTATGMQSEFGKIAELVQEEEEEETPLQRKLDSFAKKIAKVVVAVCAIIFALEAFEVASTLWHGSGVLNVEGFIQAFMSSISLAVSAVPEGLPAIVTISLALGAREFARRNAIIRKLSAAEGLGAVTVICSDKTGTLTKGEMTVRKLYVNNKFVDVSGVGYEPKGEFQQDNKAINPVNEMELATLLKIGSLCSNAQLEQNNNGSWIVIGDPTEGALIVAAAKAGFAQKELAAQYPRISEEPFTSERKRMTTVHLTPEKEKVAFMKGAPEIVLERCSYLLENEEEKKLTPAKRKKILEVNEQMASSALRVLAMAYKRLPAELNDFNEKTIEEDLVFVGLEGMIDPPRDEAIEANKKCEKAGIKTVMITGDHKLTAVAVAKEIGMMKENSLVLTGAELDAMSEQDFEKIVENVAVYARVSPEHKLKIVKALKAKGHIVAMTGDGVNDAPAVKAADIGVSMGITGTDVTREASDLVLTDDNFATIVKAVEEGRVIYDNIRKYARFLIACNFDELLVIGSFAILGGIFSPELFPLPLLPAMILWINLVTDGAPAVSLATDPPDVDVMDRKPRKPEEGILHGMGRFIIASFILQATGTILVFCLEYYVWPAHGFGTEETLREARTTAFVQAAMFELFVVWNCRSETRSVWRMGKDAFKNKFFVIAEVVSIAATLGITYIPVTAKMFGLSPLSITDLAYVIGVASWGFLILPEFLMNRKIWKWK